MVSQHTIQVYTRRDKMAISQENGDTMASSSQENGGMLPLLQQAAMASSDEPSMVLVSSLLNGDNFLEWNTAARISLNRRRSSALLTERWCHQWTLLV